MAEQPSVSRAVFLSYASEDAEAAARICQVLRSAGIEVWFDHEELRGGDAWDIEIKRQIHECALFLPLISSQTNARTEGYFRREWRLAVERTRDMADDTPFVLPVVIDDIPEKNTRVPERFREVQWTRFLEGDVPSAFVERVSSLLASLGTAEHSTAATLHTHGDLGPTMRTGHRGTLSWKAVMLASAAAMAFAIAYFAIGRLQQPERLAAGTRDVTEAAQGQITQKSIAVLPFTDMSEKGDQAYFADGMAEEILDLLAKLPELRVIGRMSSFQFKSGNEDLRTIGKKLGASYLVEGSVRKSGSRIRVAAQLIDAQTGSQLWADSFDRDFGDVLILQNQVASGIARTLQLAVIAEDARPNRPLQSTAAYTHYLRGRAALDRGDDSSIREAIAELEQALALDAGFTRAAEALVLAHLSLMGNAGVSSKVGWPILEVAARKALQLDPKSALTHAILGLKYATYDYNWPAANAELRQALVLNTRDPVALYHTSWLAFDLGQHEEAMRLQSLSVSIDPLNPDAHQNGGIIQYLIGNLDAAERGIRASMQISPTFVGNHWYLGQIYLQRGDKQRALTEMLAEKAPGTRDFGLALAYYALGRKAESDAALVRGTHALGHEAPMNVAIVYAYRGERDQAFAWLNKAVNERDVLVGHKFWDEPKLEPLRSDPRYKELLGKLNRPPATS